MTMTTASDVTCSICYAAGCDGLHAGVPIVARATIVEALGAARARGLLPEEGDVFLRETLGLPALSRVYMVTITISRTYVVEQEVEAPDEEEATEQATQTLWKMGNHLDTDGWMDQKVLDTTVDQVY